LFGSFLPSLLVGFSTTNFTRAREPTLSCNQLRSLRDFERYGLVSSTISSSFDPSRKMADSGTTKDFAETILYESREARDAVLKKGMEKGVARSYERLAEMLASIAA
jgi:hypothetical protein